MGRHSSRHLLLWTAAALALALTGCDSKKPAANTSHVPTPHTLPANTPLPAEVPMTSHPFGDWSLSCPTAGTKNRGCEVREDVLEASDHKEIARLQILRLNGAETLLVTLPYNTLLEPGIGLVFNTARPQIFPYEVCNSVGCVVRIPFAGKFAGDFAGAGQARILFAGLDGKPVGLAYSMTGFADALAAFKQKEPAQNGN